MDMGVADEVGTEDLAALIVTVSPASFMPESTPVIARPANGGEAVAPFGLVEGDEAVAGKVVAHVKVEVAPHDQRRVCALRAPCGKRGASYQHDNPALHAPDRVPSGS